MYRVVSAHTHYPLAVGKKVGERRDGMTVLEFKRGKKRAYLPENIELVRPLPSRRVQPGEKAAHRTMYYEVFRGKSPHRGQVGKEVRGLRDGAITLEFNDGGTAVIPIEELRWHEPSSAEDEEPAPALVVGKGKPKLYAARTYQKCGVWTEDGHGGYPLSQM